MLPSRPTPARVCTRVALAAERVAAGIDVVLIVAEGSAPPPLASGPGRLAVLVGDPGRAADLTAAAAMAAELFGA